MTMIASRSSTTARVSRNARRALGGNAGERLVFCSDPYEALDGAHALLLVTEWKQFRNPDFDLMKRKLKAPVIFDGRNLYEPWAMERLGFVYHSIGRPSVGA